MLNSIYFRSFVLLCILYILTNSFGWYFAAFDFVVIVYIFFVRKVNERNFMQLGLIFGLFADFIRSGVFGPNVLLFMLFGLMKMRSDILFDMDKRSSRFLFYLAVVLAYVLFNTWLEGYLRPELAGVVIGQFVLDSAVLLISVFTLEFAGVIEDA